MKTLPWWSKNRRNDRLTLRSRRRPSYRPWFEPLETRINPAVSLLAVGAEAGSAPLVSLFDEARGELIRQFEAYDSSFQGGVRVALGDVNGDGSHDVVTAPGAGGGPHVKVFDGRSGNLLREFFAYDANFVGGVNITLGDIDADGIAEIVTGAGSGGGPHVKAFEALTGTQIRSFFAYDPSFLGGVTVAAGDVNRDGRADIVTGAGAGGGPHVRVFDRGTSTVLSEFFAYEPSFQGGVFVAAADLTADGAADIVTGAGAGGGPHVKLFNAAGTVLSEFFAYDAAFDGGVRVAAGINGAGRAAIMTVGGSGAADIRVFNAPGESIAASLLELDEFVNGATIALAGLPTGVGELSEGMLGNFFEPVIDPSQILLTLELDPLNIDLLGLQVQTSPITVTVSVDPGDGRLLGNLLTVVSNLVNLEGINTAVNNVLDSVVGLVNSAALVIDTTIGDGPHSSAPESTTPILDLFIAPVHVDLLGARIDTSSITVTVQANAGEGLILGNVLTALAHLFDPPLPEELDLAFINDQLANLLDELNQQIPFIASAPVDPVVIDSNSEVLRLVVPPIDLNLLGLNLVTEEIRVNADAQTGSGELLGNVITVLLNTIGATPEEREELSNNLNGLLAKVVGVLNATNLVLPTGAIDGLSQVLQTLSLPILVAPTAPATAEILTVEIASPDGPPINVDLLGLHVTTSNIHAQLLATTGEGQVLGNLVYNIAHLFDGGGALNLLTVLNLLAL